MDGGTAESRALSGTESSPNPNCGCPGVAILLSSCNVKGLAALVKIGRWTWAIWIGALSMVLGSAVAGAQTSAGCTTPVALGALSLAPLPTIGVPYTATVITTKIQTLANGKVEHESVTTVQARDAAGRTFEERSLGCQPGPNGIRRAILRKFIFNPATGTTFSWNVDDPAKTVTVLRVPPKMYAPIHTKETVSPEVAARAMQELGIGPGVSLGTRKIAGVTAEGRRFVGASTPGHPYVRETWWNRRLSLEMLNNTYIAAKGRTIVKVVKLKLGPPDPALFVPPAGYAMVPARRRIAEAHRTR